MNPFAPNGYLEPYNSLNRVVLRRDAGGLCPEEYDGMQAVQLLAADALLELIEKEGPIEELQRRYPRRHWPQGLAEIAFGDCPSKKRQKTAQGIVEEYARRVEAFLGCLLTGPEECRRSGGNWNEDHWDWWSGVDDLVLGGGLAQGYYGYAIRKRCEPLLEKLGKSLVLPSRRGMLPLLGAAAAASAQSGRDGWVTALDFGHNSVKRALVRVEQGSVEDVLMLESAETPRDFRMPDGVWHADPVEVRRFFFDLTGRSLEESGRMLESRRDLGGGEIAGVGVSLANYVAEGRVVPRGLYGFLDLGCGKNTSLGTADGGNCTSSETIRGASNIGRELEDFCCSRGCEGVRTVLLHDGTAAAMLYAGSSRRTAVILLGSAIGSGFAP